MSLLNQKPLKEQKLAFVIFGISGDLALRMLIPSLETISCYNPFSEETKIIGVARTHFKGDELKQKLIDGVKKFSRMGKGSDDDNATCETPEYFFRRFEYIAGDYDSPATYKALNAKLDERNYSGVLIYFATPPTLIQPIATQLGNSGLTTNSSRWVRIVIEKPFGWSYESSIALNDDLHRKLGEEDIYRIDHYLAKETVMNIFTFRWGNAIWEPLWNRNYISHVEIVVAESVDVGTRIGYYDQASVLRDMIQNHLLQILSIVAMEPPSEMNSKSIRDEKMKVLHAIRSLRKEDVILGQYLGYHDHKGVPSDSSTPTLAYIRFFIDNWRWQDVPFFVCSGKALNKKHSTVKLVFKEVPHAVFGSETISKPNVLKIKIQPEEGIVLKQHVKVPGMGLKTSQIPLSFLYKDKFGDNALQGAYERVILDAIRGDQSFFPRSDEIEQSWKIVDQILACKYFVIPYAKQMDLTFGSLKRNKKHLSQKNLYKTPSDLVVQVTEQISRAIVDSIRERGICNIALSGGNSPRPILSLLATSAYSSRIDFSKLHIFFVDERCVPPTDQQSNYKMVSESFIKCVKIPESNIHRMKGELDPQVAAREYQAEIVKHFGTEDPVFDLITLGMGPEAHTASLFPGTPAVSDKKSLVIGHFVPHVNMNRVTMGQRVINNARNVIFIIQDTDKSEALNLVFNAPYVPAIIPAQVVSPKHGELTWNILVE